MISGARHNRKDDEPETFREATQVVVEAWLHAIYNISIRAVNGIRSRLNQRRLNAAFK